jgi:methyl-accepting chemotaxis protein
MSLLIQAMKPDPMSGNGRLRLRRKLRQAFGLMLLLTLLAGGGLMLDLGRLPLQAGAIVPGRTAAETPALAIQTQARARRGILGFTVLVLAGLATTYLFLQRRLIVPLEHAAAAGRRMAEGRLDQTLPVEIPDEIGQINENMNTLGVNLQELIVLVWNQTGNSVRDLDHLRQGLPPQGTAEAATVIGRLQQDLGDMQRMVKAFDLYDVVLTGTTARAAQGVGVSDPRPHNGAHKE